jgi:hypothetical protein
MTGYFARRARERVAEAQKRPDPRARALDRSLPAEERRKAYAEHAETAGTVWHKHLVGRFPGWHGHPGGGKDHSHRPDGSLA